MEDFFSSPADGGSAERSEAIGLSDAITALLVSYRTVENHVAAVLMRLDEATRDAAIDAPRDRGFCAAH